jgi:hypothetical protein
MDRRGRDLYDNWWLALELSMQSVPITNNVVNSNTEQARCTRHNNNESKYQGYVVNGKEK